MNETTISLTEWLRRGVLVDEAGLEILKARQAQIKTEVRGMKRRKF